MSDYTKPDDKALESALLKELERLAIGYTLTRHPPTFTTSESAALGIHQIGGACKTLLVKDKKKQVALIVADADTQVDLKKLALLADMGRLSFASAERLYDILRLRPGSVTPFALYGANIPENGFKVILDKRMMQHSELNYHPMHNRATVRVARENLEKFIRAMGHQPLILDIAL